MAHNSRGRFMMRLIRMVLVMVLVMAGLVTSGYVIQDSVFLLFPSCFSSFGQDRDYVPPRNYGQLRSGQVLAVMPVPAPPIVENRLESEGENFLERARAHYHQPPLRRVLPARPVEPPPFTVTIRRPQKGTPLLIPGCRPTDTLQTFLNRAWERDDTFCQGIRTRITFSLDDQDPDTEARRKPLELIVYHESVLPMKLWEVGVTSTNCVVKVYHHIMM
jgi:hypothetical protein